jgi:hypothetical protein
MRPVALASAVNTIMIRYFILISLNNISFIWVVTR